MTVRSAPLTEGRAWKALAVHYEEIRELHLRQLFAADPTRGERLTAEAVELYLDWLSALSRNSRARLSPRSAMIVQPTP
jgi:glucose-6-phosphate isomerase